MKQAFKEIGKSYATAAAEIGCSKPMLVAVVNHGRWPKKGADKLREKLKQYFETNGADIPASLRNEPNAAPAHPNESEDKEMLLRKATLTQAARRHFGRSAMTSSRHQGLNWDRTATSSSFDTLMTINLTAIEIQCNYTLTKCLLLSR